MKTMLTVLMIGAVALTSGCASMSSSPGQFGVSGMVDDPVRATAVGATVSTNQYNAETQRLVQMKMLENGMYPGNPGYGNFGTNGTYGAYGPGGTDYWYHYRGQVGQQQVVPAMPQGVVIQGQEVTTQDIERVEEKADDALCMHWKKQQKELGRPITPCPLKKK